MASKQDTPIKYDLKNKTSSSRPGAGGKLFTNTYNDELMMNVLILLKKEVLTSNKHLSDTQTAQFNDHKNNLKFFSSQIAELKAENFILREELGAFILESSSSSVQPHEIVSQVLRESFEPKRFSTNLIAYGIPKSTSSLISERITYDKSKIVDILGPIENSIPSSFKLTRLAKARSEAMRPLKIIFDSNATSVRLFTDYVIAKRLWCIFPRCFSIS